MGRKQTCDILLETNQKYLRDCSFKLGHSRHSLRYAAVCVYIGKLGAFGYLYIFAIAVGGPFLRDLGTLLDVRVFSWHDPQNRRGVQV